MVTRYLNTEHVNAQVKAMKSVGVFKIEKTSTTVVAKLKKSDREVYRGIKHSNADHWIVRHEDELFECRVA